MDLVLADDFSGATEMAGIAARTGANVQLSTRAPEHVDAEILILDTDTRLLPPDEAARQVTGLCARIRSWNPHRLFKKIDSVLRGPVVEEALALLDGLDLSQAILASANPSRNRIIRDQIYWVDGKPLHESVFATDPVHPATTSKLREIVKDSTRLHTPDVTTEADLEVLATQLRPDELAVGGADFFRVLLGKPSPAPPPDLPPGRRLWICGSQTIRNHREVAFQQHEVPIVEALTRSMEPEDWARKVTAQFRSASQVAMELSRTINATLEDTDLLLNLLGSAGQKVLTQAKPSLLFLEGGATARSLIDHVGWSRFRVLGELSPGVVMVQPCLDSPAFGPPPCLVVKPGSYPWPDWVFAPEENAAS